MLIISVLILYNYFQDRIWFMPFSSLYGPEQPSVCCCYYYYYFCLFFSALFFVIFFSDFFFCDFWFIFVFVNFCINCRAWKERRSRSSGVRSEFARHFFEFSMFWRENWGKEKKRIIWMLCLLTKLKWAISASVIEFWIWIALKKNCWLNSL